MRITDPAGRSGQSFRNVAGSLPPTELVTVSENYSVGDTVGIVMVQTMRNPVAITLPRAAVNSGRVIAIRKTDNGQDPVTIRSANGETVGGSSWLSLTADGEYAQLQSDGSEWQVVAHF